LRDIIDNTQLTIPLSRILDSIKDNGFSDSTFQDEDVDLEYKVMLTDIPRSDGGESMWELEPIHNHLIDDISQDEDNVLQLAHVALGMVVLASEKGNDVDEDILNELISRAEDRLQILKERKVLSPFLSGAAAAVGELHGRKAADAILWFALAGVDSSALYNNLVDIATAELQRFGMNSSCRAKDVLHIVERIAMAGIQGESSQRLYRVAADCLEVKLERSGSQESDDATNIHYEVIIQSLRDDSFGLHSDRSLLGLWRFSTRQRKQRSFFQNAARHYDGKFKNSDSVPTVDGGMSKQYDWSDMFDYPSRPLVVDIGCGMGVSVLGLATLDQRSTSAGLDIQIDRNECNFIGVDLSSLAIRYAQGVRFRWGLGNLNFVVDSAEECLDRIRESYPGEVKLAMVQFPTPYRFESIATDDSGNAEDLTSPSVARRGFNSQLPEGALSDDFMVTERLLSKIHDVLSVHSGQLLVQSNCEDVAVHVRNVATTKVGFEGIPFSDSVTSLEAVTQRAQKWVDIGGERATGKHFSSTLLLPEGGRTETEVACILDGKPVHRCLLRGVTKDK